MLIRATPPELRQAVNKDNISALWNEPPKEPGKHKIGYLYQRVAPKTPCGPVAQLGREKPYAESDRLITHPKKVE
jgi:hypothetical protein